MSRSVSMPSNGGVIVTFYRAPDEVHAHGHVAMKGNGVPWLEVGQRVMYDAERSTPVTIRGADSSPSECYRLVDQRNILALLGPVDTAD